MEKTLRKCSNGIWFSIFISSVFFFLLFCFDYSSFIDADNGVRFIVRQVRPLFFYDIHDSCSSRYIYIHRIPAKFNDDLLEHCHLLTRGSDRVDMCPYIVNSGFGPAIENSNGVFSNGSWFRTNQFLLDVIFHNKMKNYECLTNDSSVASAIFVPFYAGLDVSLYLWNANLSERDASGMELLEWVSQKPEWTKMSGRDHFLVGGRISWDFRRKTEESSDWGSRFRFLPESQNMTMLSVEGSSWNNDFAIPYPTNFHPSKDYEVLQWQNRMRIKKRPFLFAFAGGPRPEMESSIRGLVIEQCIVSNGCKFINCSSLDNFCENPENLMSVFQSSVFCLQPPGDSYTRRSIFDSIIAGCIPVFFHPGTAFSQYFWHFPTNQTTYSVYIPVRDVKTWEGNIEKTLMKISKEEEAAIREEVINLIPSIIYADPREKLGNYEDGFDLAIKGVLERIDGVRRKIREGKDPSIGFADEDDYKYTFSDRLQEN